jgi:hypothetical protein
MKLFLVLFSLFSCHFFPLGPNSLLTNLFSNTLTLRCSISVRDRGTYPRKAVGGIVGIIF